MSDYGIRTRLNLPYEQAVQRVTEALKAEGFGVLTQIDVKETLKQKLNVDFRRCGRGGTERLKRVIQSL